jgi:DNA-binding response OmpR family regulator
MQAAGYQVDSVSSVACALNLLDGTDYQLVIVQSSAADAGGLAELASQARCPLVVLPATFVAADLLAGLGWSRPSRRGRYAAS